MDYSSYVSTEFLGIFVPTVMYWFLSGIYALFANTKKYRLHPKEEEDIKNIPSRIEVIKIVLLQQSIQISVNLILFMFISDNSDAIKPEPPLFVRLIQFISAMAIMDTYQYFVHRFLHTNKFLYRHIHSKHHNLIVPYAYAALYAHPFEGFILDIIGGGLACLLSGMTPSTAVYFFTFGTMKTVDDHCGFMLPGHPVHVVLENNSAYHDVHHQLYGNKYNFSQPFFVTWDKIMGTYMPHKLEEREDGGFEAKPLKKE